MIAKHPLLPERVRRPPRQGFSWIDRRFLRVHAKRLSPEAILLYLFLAAVSDQFGLSFYSDATVAALLGLDARTIALARDELIAQDLVAYRYPLSQLLSLPSQASSASGLPQLFDAGP
jgi:hypothetical protein